MFPKIHILVYDWWQGDHRETSWDIWRTEEKQHSSWAHRLFWSVESPVVDVKQQLTLWLLYFPGFSFHFSGSWTRCVFSFVTKGFDFCPAPQSVIGFILFLCDSRLCSLVSSLCSKYFIFVFSDCLPQGHYGDNSLTETAYAVPLKWIPEQILFNSPLKVISGGILTYMILLRSSLHGPHPSIKTTTHAPFSIISHMILVR
jgi:hypothetical protein